MKLAIQKIKEIIEYGTKPPEYKACVAEAVKISVHANGDFPGELISERRPGEDKDIQEYRKKIFESVTEATMGKVFNELSKIRRSGDWSISHSSDVPAKIRKGESLEEYCEQNYPVFDSLTNWVFEELLKTYTTDPNAVCVVLPLSFEKENTDFYKPVVSIIPSENILDFLDTEYCLYKSTEKGFYYSREGELKSDADIFYYIDIDEIHVFQRNGHEELQRTHTHKNLLKQIPAFKVPGIFYKKVGKNKVNKSRLSPMSSFLNEATREYSDLQAEVVQHIHSTMWFYSNESCKGCHGTGKVSSKLPGSASTVPVTCQDCEGSGFVQTSPYKQNFRVTPPSNTSSHQIPTPPAGYIQKNTDIVKLQSERVKEHLYDALAAINFEYLMQVPLSQSGVAKAYDRDSANNFAHSVAEDLVRVMGKVYDLINKWRYIEMLPEDKMLELLPVITVPEKFDLFNSQIILQQIRSAKDAGLNPLLVNEMSREFAAKYFNADPSVASMFSAVLEMDTLSGFTSEEKVMLVSAGLVKKEDAIRSCYIQNLVQNAVSEDTSFLGKTSLEKSKVLEQKVSEKINEMSAVKKLIPPSA